MENISRGSSQEKCRAIAVKYVAPCLVLLFFAFFCIPPDLPCAGEDKPLAAPRSDDVLTSIVNPFNATCYDWEGNIIPCVFKRPYAERIAGNAAPDSRFTDNRDGTVTDNMTNLVWLKHTNCFGIQDWQRAVLAAKSLEAGDCGPDPDLVLSDGSSAGDWRLPTMKELCTLIDFSSRDPALPAGHVFSHPPAGYHWSATALASHSEMAWIVYFESGTTCYEHKQNRSGHILPVRSLKQQAGPVDGRLP